MTQLKGTFKCRNGCGKLLCWKLPYQKGEKPYEFQLIYGKIKYIGQHNCQKSSFQKDDKLPKVYVSDTPTFYLCLKCNEMEELVNCGNEKCVQCKYFASYCLKCKGHPTNVYVANDKFKVIPEINPTIIRNLEDFEGKEDKRKESIDSSKPLNWMHRLPNGEMKKGYV